MISKEDFNKLKVAGVLCETAEEDRLVRKAFKHYGYTWRSGSSMTAVSYYNERCQHSHDREWFIPTKEAKFVSYHTAIRSFDPGMWAAGAFLALVGVRPCAVTPVLYCLTFKQVKRDCVWNQGRYCTHVSSKTCNCLEGECPKIKNIRRILTT